MTNQSQTQDQSTTELQQATKQVNPAEIADNVQVTQEESNDTASGSPQPLNDKEQTPFIDESLRTDK